MGCVRDLPAQARHDGRVRHSATELEEVPMPSIVGGLDIAADFQRPSRMNSTSIGTQTPAANPACAARAGVKLRTRAISRWIPRASASVADCASSRAWIWRAMRTRSAPTSAVNVTPSTLTSCLQATSVSAARISALLGGAFRFHGGLPRPAAALRSGSHANACRPTISRRQPAPAAQIAPAQNPAH